MLACVGPSCLFLGAAVQPPWPPVQPCEPSEDVDAAATEDRPGPCGPPRADLGDLAIPPILPAAAAAVSDSGDVSAGRVGSGRRGQRVGVRGGCFEVAGVVGTQTQVEVRSQGEIGDGGRVEGEKRCCPRAGLGGRGRGRGGGDGENGDVEDGGGGLEAQAVGG